MIWYKLYVVFQRIIVVKNTTILLLVLENILHAFKHQPRFVLNNFSKTFSLHFLTVCSLKYFTTLTQKTCYFRIFTLLSKNNSLNQKTEATENPEICSSTIFVCLFYTKLLRNEENYLLEQFFNKIDGFNKKASSMHQLSFS